MFKKYTSKSVLKCVKRVEKVAFYLISIICKYFFIYMFKIFSTLKVHRTVKHT